jgi:hypothetical protein
MSSQTQTKYNLVKPLFIVVLVMSLLLFTREVWADSVTTSVTVGNSAPSFTVNPAESPASDGTTPTNAGSAVTFTATATDSNSENYYLIICKTNSVTATNGGAPTCGGGSWCVSSSTSSGSQATCSYTTLTGDAESNAWFGFVCDGNSSAAACSSSSQGSGSSGSPFKVNHAPAFTAISNNGPANPGGSIVWSTSVGTTDTDTDTASDTVKLVICKTTGLLNGDCDGGASDRWCTGSLAANNPTCTYSVPTPTPDTTYTAYAYVVDSHNFGATGGTQGSTSNFTISNVAPVVSSVTVNGGSDITLTEGTTTAISLTATVTDNNSCQDLSTVTASLYRSGITYTGCDTVGEANNNNCYAVISCSVGGGNTCDGPDDASASYQCTVNVQYYADPTDAGTQYPTETWKDTVKATDNNSATGSTEVSTGVEVNSLVGYDVTTSINYGNLAVGAKNDPLDKITTVTATGNVGLDEELSGTDMSDGSGHTITVGNQKYALAASTSYASGIALTTSPVESELNVQKTTSGTAATKDTYWGLLIPNGTVSGAYSGTNTIVAVKGEIVNW